MEVAGKVFARMEISEEETKRVALEFFCRATGWKSNYFTSNGSLYYTVEYHGSHAWDEDVLVREATPDDLRLERTYNQLKVANL